MTKKTTKEKIAFTGYQKFVIAILALLQFTVILDFMVISPLGAILMKELSITPSKFGVVVSAYAFSAGIAGLVAAGFADKYDRKKLLAFFYSGFILGTLMCALAPTYEILLVARIVTGLFGGVVGSVSLAIVTDLFPMEVRGRVMGFIQMAFAASQVLGIPTGLILANLFGWHAPFYLIVGLAIAITITLLRGMQPVNKHLEVQQDNNAFQHLAKTISQKYYILAFVTTGMLSIGGFMMMPFSTAFLVNNVKIEQAQLPLVFMITGLCSIVTLPLIGKISDKVGKFPMFIAGSIVASIMVIVYTNLSVTPLWVIIIINAIMFAGIMSRMIPSSALMTAMPTLKDRGAFMGINSSVQQIAGGIASVFAGLIVSQKADGAIVNFNILGYVCVGMMCICVCMMYFINKHVSAKMKAAPTLPVEDANVQMIVE